MVQILNSIADLYALTIRQLFKIYNSIVRGRTDDVIRVSGKTRSAKIVRGAIKKKYLGQDLGDLSSVDNVDALQAIPTLNP